MLCTHICIKNLAIETANTLIMSLEPFQIHCILQQSNQNVDDNNNHHVKTSSFSSWSSSPNWKL